MAILVKQSGISSGTVPDTLSNEPFATAGSIFYVDSVTGSDTNAGTLEEAPKATVFGASGALSVATTNVGDMIVCLATHRETVSSTYTFIAGTISIVGKGSGTSRATFTSSVTGQMLSFGAITDVWIENVVFAASTGATTVRLGGCYGLCVKNCQFYCGANDTADCVLIGASSVGTVLDGCTFTASASGAARAIKLSSASNTNGIRIQDCVIDGGSYGWSGAAVSITAAALAWKIRGLTLSNYSDLNISTSGAKGNIIGLTVDESSSWQWNP